MDFGDSVARTGRGQWPELAGLAVRDLLQVHFNLPSTWLFRLPFGPRETAKIFVAFDLPEAHASAGRRHELPVVEVKAPTREMLVQRRETHCRCVGLMREL